METKKINNEKVEPIPLNVDNRPVKGGQISPDPYMNIFLLAPTNCGKTCGLFHILKKIVGRDTAIMAFVATQNMDPSWEYIEEYFEEKGNPIIIHDSIYEENGSNNLDDLINYWKSERRKEQKKDEDPSLVDQLYDQHYKKEKNKKRKSKYQYPQNILIFDDMGDQIRIPSFTNFIKKSRHHRVKIICSSQDWCDMPLPARNQIKQFLIFHGVGHHRLNSIYENMDANIPYDKFYQLFENATQISESNPKPFLFAIPQNNDYRICFDKKFEL